jgi:type III pantothenate kinase
LLQNIQNVDGVWVASVAAPELDVAFAHAVRTRWHIDPVFVRSTAAACGVRNAYAQPERLGVDRFLALIAAHARQQGAVVIAGCGTALTLDALAADGRHLGGLIAPAPELMRSALLGNTARLGNIDAARIVEIADNTADAVLSGTWLAAAALVERFVAQAAGRVGMAPALLLGGGGAAQLGALLALPHRIDAELVLRGLARYADQHAPAAVG